MKGPELHLHPDLAQLKRLAAAAELPTDDLGTVDLSHFFGVGPRENPQGVVGLELFGDSALLRSLVVIEPARGTGLGRLLVGVAEQHAKTHGVEAVYLLTTTAADFFERLGYRRIARGSAPAKIQGTREYRGLCPASAALMMKRVGAD